MDAPLVRVEAHLASRTQEVKKAKDRVRAALQIARFEFPARRITVNLAPADLPKESGCFDLPSRSAFSLRLHRSWARGSPSLNSPASWGRAAGRWP
jgi:predicted ATPase with chaperone activity